MSLNCDTRKEIHICLVCDEKFEQKDILKVHLKNHTYKVENFNLSATEAPESFELESCSDELFPNEYFFDEVTLNDQINKTVPIKFKEIHVCSTCGKEFKRKDHLKKHYIIHSGKRPFICFVCGKDFARKDRFKDHCTTHLSNGWSCYFCGRMFSQRYILRKHEMIHRGVKPYSCDLCDRKFSRKNDLLRHGTSHSGEKTNFCEICGKGFSQKRLLKRHLRIHKSNDQIK
ncbi:zinc finger protein [Trichonephila inaurata madagascariensis]|uniref:Zinc finger protein n=1 Tax=Trichonephila inaurata madagascariensis TaxID=2747483 RepID=A0A8X6YEQ7_9ARAC|nr:zinc finger protein [Trichonephila inaurata madagascariensis]